MAALKTTSVSKGFAVLVATGTGKLWEKWRQVLDDGLVLHHVAHWSALEGYLRALKPSVLLLDLALPGLTYGTTALSILLDLSPSTSVILLDGSSNQEQALRAFKAGAKGYCSKDIDPRLLAKAVRVVERGEIWAARSMIPSLLDELASLKERQRNESHADGDDPSALLTSRECDVCQLIADGLSNREVSTRLSISEKTVKAHLTSIFQKLEISDRLRLALLISGLRRGKSLKAFRSDQEGEVMRQKISHDIFRV